MSAVLEELPPEKLPALLAKFEAEKARRVAENKLAAYVPYLKQAQFHTAGATHRERLLIAGNQVGKSLASTMELAAHATGLYPSWWQGFRFDRAIRAWACGETAEVVRETIQLLLLGEPGQYGTGCLPKATIVEVTPARGIADLADMIRVQHVSGGVSTVSLKAYSQGRERFQGATIDYCMLDEEPDADIFSEALTRTNVTQGPVVLTFTPLKGISTVVKRFLLEQSGDRVVITMTLDDALHYDAAQKAQIIASYPEHERATRTKGVPAMGSGRVFTVDEEKLLVEPFECPRHWVRLGGMDFGWTHFAAFVEMWWDRDLDVVYLVRTLRLREQTPLQQVEVVRGWRLRWAWPHDGRNATLAGAGLPLMRQYADAGLDMMHEHATFADGGNSVEAGVLEMADRMRGGRWKVFKGQNDAWLEEYRMYHRKDGLLVKEGDDAISASRYGLMMLRSATTRTPAKRVAPARAAGGWMSA
jgi:phage terminase large subunit-like protein